MKKKPSSKYYFLMAAACFLVVSVSLGLGYNCWSVLTVPICEGLGITRQQFSAFYTMIMLGMTVGALALARLVRWFGMMRVVTGSAVCITLALILLSRAEGIGLFYFCSFLIGLAMVATGYVSFSEIIANWFLRFRGLVTGFVFMGSALASIFLSPAIGRVSAEQGWRTAVLGMGITAGVVCIPLCLFVIRERPEEAGLVQLSDGTDTAREDAGDMRTGFMQSELLKKPMFWCFILFMLGGYVEAMHSVTTVPHLQDVGYTQEYASIVWSCCMAALAFFRVTLGAAVDRFGVYRVTLLAAVLTPLNVIGLLLAEGRYWAVVPIVLGMGVGESLLIVGTPLIVGELFGHRDYTRIYGLVTAVSQVAGIVMPLVYGAVYTAAGTYAPSYLAAAFIYAAGFICLLLAFSIRKRTVLPEGN